MSTLARLLKLIAPFQRWIVLGILLGFLTIGSSVGLMAMSSYLISRAALVSDVADIAIPITFVRVFAILRAGFRYLERYFTHTATFRILTHLRVWFYTAIEPLAPARLIAVRSGDLLTRIVGDIETLENFYVRVVVPPLTAALVTCFACLILGAFDARLAVALLLFLILTGVILPLAARWASKQSAAALITTRSDLNATLVDQIQGLPDLLSFDQARRHQERALALSRALNRVQERMAMIRGVSNALAALCTSLAGLTVLGLAIPLVSGGKIDGVFLALLPLTAIASFEAVQPLALALQQLDANRAAGQRLFELIDETPATGDPETPAVVAGTGIEVRNLRFSYAPADAPALDDVSFSVPAGGRVAIVGASGSGKSTIVNLLLRFWDYEQGRILLGGRDLHEYAIEDVRRMLAVVPQQVHLFNATLRDNLVLASPDASDEQIVAACTMAQLDDFVRSLPDGYDTVIGENGLLMSGGERQRLAVARAILKNAPILIMDEATANLDTLTEQRLMDALEPFMRGRTVLIISHRRMVRAHVDQVISLEKGRVVTGA
jgi:ATP-binding cassette, subfamily C, bacterial CydC